MDFRVDLLILVRIFVTRSTLLGFHCFSSVDSVRFSRCCENFGFCDVQLFLSAILNSYSPFLGMFSGFVYTLL